MIAHNAKSRLKNPLIVLAAYALLNAIIYLLGGFLIADGWSSIGNSIYGGFLHFIFFWIWPVIIGISIIHILSIMVDKKKAMASLKFALLFGFSGPLTLYILVSTSNDPIAGMAYILSAAYYCVFAVVGFIISSIVIWAYNKNKTKWISLPSFTKRMIAFIAVAAIIIFISLIINNYVFTPPPVAFPVEKNVYTLYAKVYNSRGHEEFVKNFEESYKTLSKTSDRQKFYFLLLVFLYCNLDAGNWTVFCWEIQKDNNSFWKQLCTFTNTDDFKKIPRKKRVEIKVLVSSFKANEHYLDVGK
jgi:hypothetical protein